MAERVSSYLAFSLSHPHERGLSVPAPERFMREFKYRKLLQVPDTCNLAIKWLLAPLVAPCYSDMGCCSAPCSSPSCRTGGDTNVVSADLVIWFCLALWFQISQDADWFYDTMPLSPLAPSLFYYPPPPTLWALCIYSPMIINRF